MAFNFGSEKRLHANAHDHASVTVTMTVNVKILGQLHRFYVYVCSSFSFSKSWVCGQTSGKIGKARCQRMNRAKAATATLEC
jgi:hypothetical protein